MSIVAEIQHACEDADVPDDESLQQWVELVLEELGRAGSLVIRLVDEAESQQLNFQYRHKNAPTNVLSFPFEAPVQVEDNYLGDIVICVPVVIREAAEQGKPANWHWAHMVIHGMLHLLGFDHINEVDAKIMEQQEITLLQKLGINNPYESEI